MKLFTFILLLFFSASVFAQKTYLLVGTYTTGKSTGMYVYDFDRKDGSVKIIDSVQTKNPSYLTVAPNEKFVYAVNETSKGHVSAFAFDNKTGHLRFLNQQSSMGDDPCYVIVDKTGRWVIVANYSSGTFAVFPIRSDGSLGEAVSSVKHHGHGVNPERQEGPHVHSTVLSPDNKYLFVQDLGLDKIIEYSFNDKTGTVTAKDSVKLKGGSGPRHFIFHSNGKWAYLVQEMGGTVTTFYYQNGNLKNIQTISTVPHHYKPFFTGADIHISNDGKFLYASNRDSSNTIVIYKIDPQTGKLSVVGYQSTLGKTPRNFSFDPSGNYLLVANQNSDDIVIFKVNHQTGLLTNTEKRIDVGNPVCIKWVE